MRDGITKVSPLKHIKKKLNRKITHWCITQKLWFFTTPLRKGGWGGDSYPYDMFNTNNAKNERTEVPIRSWKRNQNVLVLFLKFSFWIQIVSIWSRICSPADQIEMFSFDKKNSGTNSIVFCFIPSRYRTFVERLLLYSFDITINQYILHSQDRGYRQFPNSYLSSPLSLWRGHQRRLQPMARQEARTAAEAATNGKAGGKESSGGCNQWQGSRGKRRKRRLQPMAM